jgi:diguanylate cyclase (GGDEF)-like protein
MPTLSQQDVASFPSISEDFDPAHWIASERLRLVSSNLPSTLAVTLVCAAVLTFLLRNVTPWPARALWFIAGVFISAARYRRYRQFRRLSGEAFDTRLWTRRLLIGSALSGLFWGASAAVLFPPGDLPHQVLITFILAGLSAGAMTAYAAIWPCYALFAVPAILPMVFRMALQGSELHWSMALLGLLYLAAVIRAAIQTDRMIGNVLTVRAENLKLTQALHHQATHDPLVDLPNHREFNIRLAALAKASVAAREPFALLFVDLDRFKEINDTGGHAAGDETLRRISPLLKSRVRSKDTVARIGGDEFAVLLPACTRETAEQIASALLAAIQGFSLAWEKGKVFRLGASIGIAYSQGGEHDASALLRAADAACYAAKINGRGRIEVCPADAKHEPSGRFEISRLRQQLS